MATIEKGSFTLNLGIAQLSGELSDLDRQCAWELYVELSTRVACTGKATDVDCVQFDGELYIESLGSLYRFFQEARNIMRRFPVGRIGAANENHLGAVISRMISDVLRPFLERWQVEYRHWWEEESNPRVPPLKRQQEFPHLTSFLNDWSAVRSLLRALQQQLVQIYGLMRLNTDS